MPTSTSKKKNAKTKNKSTVATIETPLGPCRVDFKDAKDAFEEAQKRGRSPPTAEERCHEEYLGGRVSTYRVLNPSRVFRVTKVEEEDVCLSDGEVAECGDP